ncbi:helix-turn-helix domain-containing protein [Blautia fusiformis]|uniref:Helix-turn-helix transcriptional regulator n=1 Tax=Blautia fusiformis TaxID=2881264 RepID=A0AAW4W7C6_9FIRM|nr:helix-turn-helix transcriptional regulator [Blautia fusiformis]MCC2228460.1 helix-turn-helix transcriptional regulator [Blautia fusiformis]
MLRLDVKKYVDDQFENLNQFAKASGLNYQAAQKIYNGETSRITFDNLESICKVLNVTPNDIFIFDNVCKTNDSKTYEYSEDDLYKLISQIVDNAVNNAVDIAIDKKFKKKPIKIYKAKDDDK